MFGFGFNIWETMQASASAPAPPPALVGNPSIDATGGTLTVNLTEACNWVGDGSITYGDHFGGLITPLGSGSSTFTFSFGPAYQGDPCACDFDAGAFVSVATGLPSAAYTGQEVDNGSTVPLPAAPVASFTADISSQTSAALNGTGSTGTGITYHWSASAGSIGADTSASTGLSTNSVSDGTGYTVSLTVTDTFNRTDTATMTFDVSGGILGNFQPA